jgi:hypothetical protein
LRGHIDLVGVYGKVDQGALFELKDEVLGIAVVLVLVDGVAPGLARHRVLEFGGGDGDAVQAQGQVKGIVVLGGVAELAGDGEAVGGVALLGLWVHTGGGGKVGHVEEPAKALEAVAQDHEAAFVGGVQRPAEVVEQGFLGPFFLDVLEVGPFLGLGLLDKGEEDSGIEPPLGIKGLSITLGISGGGEQVMLDGGFKDTVGELWPIVA